MPVYVVVTMRSEFLGRCSEFTGLAEAFNRSQYLVPRLTRDERREAIERPLRLFATEPAPALVQQVLNDTGDDPDQLPVMQHAMLRTYVAWERAGATGRIERQHYDSVGGIEQALDRHGDEIMSSLGASAGKTVEKLFRSLTVTQGGVALRRPRKLGHLYEIAGASTPELRQQVDAIISAFADRRNSFLMLSTRELTPDTVVDITHESVIRKWRQLKNWVREESRSAEWYADLAARRGALPQPGRQVSGRIPSLRAWSSGGATMAGTKRGPNSTGAQTIRLSQRCCRFSTRAAANRRSAGARRKSSAIVSCARRRPWRARNAASPSCLRFCSSASARSRSCSTATSLKNQQITQATAEYQRLSTESQSAQARLKDARGARGEAQESDRSGGDAGGKGPSRAVDARDRGSQRSGEGQPGRAREAQERSRAERLRSRQAAQTGRDPADSS